MGRKCERLSIEFKLQGTSQNQFCHSIEKESIRPFTVLVHMVSFLCVCQPGLQMSPDNTVSLWSTRECVFVFSSEPGDVHDFGDHSCAIPNGPAAEGLAGPHQQISFNTADSALAPRKRRITDHDLLHRTLLDVLLWLFSMIECCMSVCGKT